MAYQIQTERRPAAQGLDGLVYLLTDTQAGVRADICMIPVPALMRLVRASTQAIGVTASVP